MKTKHYDTQPGGRTYPSLSAVIDDFGTQHDLILGHGDFGNIKFPAADALAAHFHSGMQDPDAYADLWEARQQ